MKMMMLMLMMIDVMVTMMIDHEGTGGQRQPDHVEKSEERRKIKVQGAFMSFI